MKITPTLFEKEGAKPSTLANLDEESQSDIEKLNVSSVGPTPSG